MRIYKLYITFIFFFLLSFLFITTTPNLNAFTADVVVESGIKYLDIIYESAGEPINAANVYLRIINADIIDIQLEEGMLGMIPLCENGESFEGEYVCFSTAKTEYFSQNERLARINFEVIDQGNSVDVLRMEGSSYASDDNEIILEEKVFESYSVNPINSYDEKIELQSAINPMLIISIILILLSIVGLVVYYVKKNTAEAKSQKMILVFSAFLFIIGLLLFILSFTNNAQGDVSVATTTVKYELGAACTSNDQCLQAKCSPLGICGGVGAVCKGIDQTSANGMCYKSKCNNIEGGICGGNGATCSIGGTATDDACTSGNCEGTTCEALTTEEKLPKGAPCKFNQQCAGAACSQLTGTCGGLGAECAAADQASANARCYESKCSDFNGGICGGLDATCKKDESGKLLSTSCISGECNEAGNCTADGILNKKPKGASCIVNSECEGSKCSPIDPESGFGVCGGLGAECQGSTAQLRDSSCFKSRCGVDKICGGEKSICEGDNDRCLSGLCIDPGICEFIPGCTIDAECGDGRYCVAGQQYVDNNIDQKYYCETKKLDGRSCLFDHQCISNICSAEGTCQAKTQEETGQSCTVGAGECPSGQFCDAGSCSLQKEDGVNCDANFKCKSQNCVSGICEAVGTAINACPNLDKSGANGGAPDGKLTLIDFASFATVFNKSCQNTIEYNECGSVDSNGDGKVNLVDYAYFGTKFGDDRTCVPAN